MESLLLSRGLRLRPAPVIRQTYNDSVNHILNADLHCHSVVSDGTLTPEALAQRAKANGVELWALTDHDEIGGQARAIAAARDAGLPYLTGTEIANTSPKASRASCRTAGPACATPWAGSPVPVAWR